MSKPLAIELFSGLSGWGEGFASEGYRVVGFDLYDMPKTLGFPRPKGDIQLVLQDVLTLHGSQFRDVVCIVASPPCTKYSFMAMPFGRCKKLAAWYREDPFRQIELNALFFACYRIQMEACLAAGRFIPLVIENVRGAVDWVGPAAAKHGPQYLWGDIPALLPDGSEERKGSGRSWFYQNGGNGRSCSSQSLERKQWTAKVSKIPFSLASFIARTFKP